MSEHTPPAGPESVTAPAARGQSSVGDTVRALVVAASIGAAVIHFAYAPVHLTDSTVHGLFFLLMGWVQLGTAFALYRWRGARWPWLVAAGFNAGVIGVWLVSHTAGVPGYHREPFGFPDGLASGLEAVVIVGSLVALRPGLLRRPMTRISPVFGGLAALALVGLVSASVSPSVVGEHTHGSDGGAHTPGSHDQVGVAAGAHDDGHGHTEAAAAVPRSARCDLGFNTAKFNDVAVPGGPHVHHAGQEVDFTIDEFARVFADPSSGIPAEAVAAYLSQPEHKLDRDGILSGGLTHTLTPDNWNPLISQKQCEALGNELDRAQAVAATYPTVASAEAAGYRKVTNYLPGIAAHYMNFSLLRDGFDLDHPEMLLYDGTQPQSHMVGLSYYVLKSGTTEPTEGFIGDNDHYHQHIGLCIKNGVVAAGSNTTQAECSSIGGNKSSGAAGWMLHAWVVPGCESDWGVFSGANPKLKVQAPGSTALAKPGCGTGKPLTAPLAFDTSGRGPQVELASGQ